MSNIPTYWTDFLEQFINNLSFIWDTCIDFEIFAAEMIVQLPNLM